MPTTAEVSWICEQEFVVLRLPYCQCPFVLHWTCSTVNLDRSRKLGHGRCWLGLDLRWWPHRRSKLSVLWLQGSHHRFASSLRPFWSGEDCATCRPWGPIGACDPPRSTTGWRRDARPENGSRCGCGASVDDRGSGPTPPTNPADRERVSSTASTEPRCTLSRIGAARAAAALRTEARA